MTIYNTNGGNMPRKITVEPVRYLNSRIAPARVKNLRVGETQLAYTEGRFKYVKVEFCSPEGDCATVNYPIQAKINTETKQFWDKFLKWAGDEILYIQNIDWVDTLDDRQLKLLFEGKVIRGTQAETEFVKLRPIDRYRLARIIWGKLITVGS